MSTTVRWLTRRPEVRSAGTTLLCFPSAGSGAMMYSGWPAVAAPDLDVVAVCPPGRERNIAFPPVTDLGSLVDGIAIAIADARRRPDERIAFFGHSFGAVVAFEVARRLWEGGSSGPITLFAAACGPVHLPRRHPAESQLDDDQLLEEVTGYGGIPDQVTDLPELRAMLLPALRADLAMSISYRADPDRPVPCSITSIGGRDDPAINPEELDRWAELTTGTHRRYLLPGNHFFLTEQVSAIFAIIRRDLAANRLDHAARANRCLTPSKEASR